MNILCVDCGLAQAFAALGHQVRSVAPGPGVVDARELAPDFTPDLLFQQESLANRTFLDRLDALPGRKAFWALDAHLNIHWHKYYARLFDAAFTPHPSLFRHMPPEWTPPRLLPLAMYGYARPWRPHAQRSRDLAFVGRDNAATRPLRSRFFRLLARFDLRPESGMEREDMLRVYGDTRVVPNESIAFEVNFRLTEAASAGACVLAPAVGEDQDRLYAPDREILVYEHGLDLVDKLAFLKRRPDLAEKLGRAAWETTNARHLIEHRAVAILEGMAPLPASPGGNEGALPMALAQRGRHARTAAPPSLLARLESAGAAGDDEAAALRLRCLSEFSPGEATEREIRAVLTLPPSSRRQESALAALGHALHTKNLPLFRAFWGWLHQARPGTRPERPASLYHACLLLAAELQKQGRLFQPGLAYDPAVLTPESALEALKTAELHAAGDREWARRLDRLTARSKTLTQARLDALAALNKAAPDWRTRLEYGCVLLDAYDAEAGLHQVEAAMAEAEREGRAGLARSILKARSVTPPPATP